MRRASASSRHPRDEHQAAQSRRGVLRGGATAGALIVGLTIAPAVMAAADDPDDAGRLSLNTTVLVNDSVGAGSSGEFAIRSSLFSDRISAQAEERQKKSAERLSAVEALDFATAPSADDPYRSVRAALFESYSSDVIASSSEEHEESSVLVGVLAVVVVPVVLLAGVVTGRIWARRRRVGT
ncbi:hypothetical protein [Leifsonia shinshuensis]|uniref:Uncharacterized protein n=2 Tax=Leifsonia shinshuensis TaxID=150026 RepID=A0A853CXB5_9MICO|nr:hypothetical protein [Leifsonia shinshuensis]NYJ23195.1 hypothetical protein [Leifsonia shinshuensis]